MNCIKIKKPKFSRSLFVTKGIKFGEIFTEENIRFIKPDYGFPSKYLKNILGENLL